VNGQVHIDPDATVSVVVPTHNRPQLVLEAVHSIVSQDHPGPIEVLVVFDGCAAHPIDVGCPPGRTVRILTNDARTPGLAGARNTGILAATGEFIGFCDDDDAWLPGKLALQMTALRNFGRDALCGTGSLVVTGESTHARPGPRRVLGLEDFLRDRIMEIASGSFLVRRRTLLDEIGLLDEDLPGSYGEDYDLLLRAARVLPVLNVARPLLRVSFHAGSFYVSRWKTVIAALTYLLDKHPEFDAVPEGRARIRGQIAFAHAALGDRASARRVARDVLRDNRREKRAYAALLASAGVPAPWVSGLARRFGHGI
jgi:glycosyltransferase involved in cell wall biosynthesis